MFWGGSEKPLDQRQHLNNIQFVNQPVDLAAVLPTCDAVINYGSTNLVCRAMMAGKPQLMLPTDIEKWLVSRRVASIGAGVMHSAMATEASVRTALDLLSEGGVIARTALASSTPSDQTLARRLDQQVSSLLRNPAMDKVPLERSVLPEALPS